MKRSLILVVKLAEDASCFSHRFGSAKFDQVVGDCERASRWPQASVQEIERAFNGRALPSSHILREPCLLSKDRWDSLVVHDRGFGVFVLHTKSIAHLVHVGWTSHLASHKVLFLQLLDVFLVNRLAG